MTVNDPYQTLMDQLKYPKSDRLRALLKHLMTEDQAQVAAALPGTAAEVAQKTGFAVETVKQILDKLFFAGIIFPKGDFKNREFYRFARSVMQFHDATQAAKGLDVVKDKKLFELWHDFVTNDWYPDMGRLLGQIPAPFARIVPAYKSVKDIEGLLPCEDYREILKAQDLIAVVPCSCRIRTTSIGEHCAHTTEEDVWHCIQFGRAAEYALAREAGKKLSYDEAVELIDKIEADGLIHIYQNNTALVGTALSCQCCTDCCENAVPMNMAGVPLGKAWQKSRFIAVADDEKCIGCQECVDRCQFDAIEMVRIEGSKSKKRKARVNPEACYGCGACVVGCDKANALSMKLVRPPDHIPSASKA
jgi:NAD-dependent dihydropyrimidine dehydrogenase PreA subunit